MFLFPSTTLAFLAYMRHLAVLIRPRIFSLLFLLPRPCCRGGCVFAFSCCLPRPRERSDSRTLPQARHWRIVGHLV